MDNVQDIIKEATTALFGGDIDQTLQLLDVATGLLQNQQSPESKLSVADIKFQFGKLIGEFQKYSLGYQLVADASEIYKELNNNEKFAQTLLYLGRYALTNSDLSTGEKHLAHAIDLYTSLGDTYLEKYYFAYAERAYFIAKSTFFYLFELVGLDKSMVSELMKKEVTARLHHYQDLCRVANYYAYSDNTEEAKKIAWRALLYALDTIPLIVKRHQLIHPNGEEIYDELLNHFVKEVIKLIPMCRNALTTICNETTPVVNLKLDELTDYFKEISDDIPDSVEQVHLWTNTQKESLKFLIPRRVPDFMFLTPDGRLIYYYTKTFVENTSEKSTMYHLFGGILVAIKSVISETKILDSGSVQEISAAGGILLLENRPNIIVCAICDIVFPDILSFLKKTADFVQNKYGELLKKWMGNSKSIQGLIQDLKQQLDEFTL